MTTHCFNSSCRVFILGIVALSLAIFALPAVAQNVRVAQREDAGESASDDPADTGELTVYPDAQQDEGEVLSEEEQAAALARRGGEQVGDDPNNLAMILGMHVQEADSGRVKVVDVAAASPAFESGVREGDEIISFDGFTAKSYREWIDGIRSLVTDTPDGSVVSVELLRGDKRITAEIQTPEAKADDVRRLGPLGQQITEQQAQGQGAPLPANQPYAPGVISDNDVFINDSGFFDDDLAGTTDRAVAEIFRITPQQAAPQQTAPLNPPNQPGGQAAAAAAGQRTPPNAARARQNPVRPNNPGVGGAGRIGMAGFRDDTNGMVVMLDVGGLAPGSYPVGIEDAGLILGGQRPMRSARNNLAPSERDVRSQERMNRVRRPFDRRTNSLQLDNPPANAPRPRPQLRQAPREGTGNQDQWQTQSTPSIPRTVLAQVTNENSGSGTATPPTGQVQPSSTPPTGEVNPNLTPPTGEVNPNLTPPTGEANPNLTPPTGQVLPPGAPPTGRVLPSGTSPTGQPDPDAVGDEGLVGLDDSDIASGNTLSGSTLALVGMLTVDQSGTGRMQQVVEGVRVRDVVGQAIVIYAPATPPTTTVPPNTNVSGTRGETATAAAAAAAAAQQQPPGTNVPGTNQPRQLPGAAPQQLATTAPITGTPTPVAAGVIRLMSDRRPNASAPGTTGATGRQNQRVQQPTARQPADAVTRPAQTPNQ
ncbi:MAG TPA: PDZ domain-containing protein [Lacipirellulaceae bacterium]